MPEDEELDHGDNRPADMVLDAKLLKMGEEYVESLRRSSNENTIRTNIRENAGKLGVPSLAWQHSLMQARTMDKGDLADYQRGLKRMKRVLDPVVADFFPEDIARQEKRRERKKAKAAKADAAAGKETPEQQQRRLAADANPRSKPKASSAKKPKLTVVGQSGVTTEESDLVQESDDELIARVAREEQAKQEQREGGALLDAAGKPLSQSAQVAAINEKLGIDGQ